jgi:hypothetical protein
MRAEGKYTMVKAQEDYYNDIRSRERIKEIIKGTIHENDID